MWFAPVRVRRNGRSRRFFPSLAAMLGCRCLFCDGCCQLVTAAAASCRVPIHSCHAGTCVCLACCACCACSMHARGREGGSCHAACQPSHSTVHSGTVRVCLCPVECTVECTCTRARCPSWPRGGGAPATTAPAVLHRTLGEAWVALVEHSRRHACARCVGRGDAQAAGPEAFPQAVHLHHDDEARGDPQVRPGDARVGSARHAEARHPEAVDRR